MTACAPLALQMFGRLTGLVNPADVDAAYASALKLAHDEKGFDSDCNATYCALTDVFNAARPGHEDTADALREGDTSKFADGDDFGDVLATTQDIAFIFGAACMFVLMTTFSGQEGRR